MVRIYIPGLTGLSLRVAVTTNGVTWTAGVVDTASRAVETVHEVIPASKIKRVCYMGTGTRVPADEGRAVVILLAAIGGVSSKELWELARIGTEPEEPPLPKRPRGRPRKHPLPSPDSEELPEIPVGLVPSAAVARGRLVLVSDADSPL